MVRPSVITPVTALVAALNGKKVGNSWIARCPAHDDREPSLSISVGVGGEVLVHCHAGCTQDEVISELRVRGLWPQQPVQFQHCAERRRKIPSAQLAMAIWAAALQSKGTLVETYLRSRGLEVIPQSSLRFHPHLRHPSGNYWPAMVALVTGGKDKVPLAIHRTFLAPNGIGKAPVKPSKMMLGPCRGGVVRLSNPGEIVMIGEGIETCLAAMQASGNTAWAALSTAGLRTLKLPENVRNVIVLVDGDDAGEFAAQDCAKRWKSEGRRVRLARPPKGMDFNDMLMTPTGGGA
jgi:hypothetical protein